MVQFIPPLNIDDFWIPSRERENFFPTWPTNKGWDRIWSFNSVTLVFTPFSKRKIIFKTYLGFRDMLVPRRVPSLKLTAKAPENGWLEYDSFPFGMAYFQRRAVSFRECTPLPFTCHSKFSLSPSTPPVKVGPDLQPFVLVVGWIQFVYQRDACIGV